MSISGGYPSVDATAPDSDAEVICPRCHKLNIQITNQAVYITFGHGIGAVMYDRPEPYLPLVGSLLRDFDAFKYRAYLPAASLPSGSNQAHVFLTPLP